jgi:hypothetical protein
MPIPILNEDIEIILCIDTEKGILEGYRTFERTFFHRKLENPRESYYSKSTRGKQKIILHMRVQCYFQMLFTSDPRNITE